MPLRTESLDVNAPHPARLTALLRGPVVFMATGAWPSFTTDADLLAARGDTGKSLLVPSGLNTPPTLFKPYMEIGMETYRTYHPIRA